MKILLATLTTILGLCILIPLFTFASACATVFTNVSAMASKIEKKRLAGLSLRTSKLSKTNLGLDRLDELSHCDNSSKTTTVSVCVGTLEQGTKLEQAREYYFPWVRVQTSHKFGTSCENF